MRNGVRFPEFLSLTSTCLNVSRASSFSTLLRGLLHCFALSLACISSRRSRRGADDQGEPVSEVPLDVAVKEPQRRVRRREPDDEVGPGLHRGDVAGFLGHERRRRGVVGARVLGALRHDPEGLPVQVQRVHARVRVVDDEVDDVAELEVEDVVARSPRGGVGGEGTGREGRVEQRGRRGGREGDVVEEKILRTRGGERARRQKDVDRLGRGLLLVFSS